MFFGAESSALKMRTNRRSHTLPAADSNHPVTFQQNSRFLFRTTIAVANPNSLKHLLSKKRQRCLELGFFMNCDRFQRSQILLNSAGFFWLRGIPKRSRGTNRQANTNDRVKTTKTLLPLSTCATHRPHLLPLLGSCAPPPPSFKPHPTIHSTAGKQKRPGYPREGVS